LTTAGQAAVERARGAIAAADAALVDRLTAQERAQLMILLHKLCGLE
jgi:DNA-binding MarR family transcriptional regulator